MDIAAPDPPRGAPLARWRPRLLAVGAALIAAAFGVLAFLDRALGGVLFLLGMSVLLDGFGQFHPTFALLFPLLALVGAVTDAARGLPGAAFTWFVGAMIVFIFGRALRRRRLGPPVRPNPALESLTAELAALKAQRERGEISEEEFRARRDAALSAFRHASPDPPPENPSS